VWTCAWSANRLKPTLTPSLSSQSSPRQHCPCTSTSAFSVFVILDRSACTSAEGVVAEGGASNDIREVGRERTEAVSESSAEEGREEEGIEMEIAREGSER
jgi:hypothetical protein